jgi:uncharacterized GH25 family protein
MKSLVLSLLLTGALIVLSGHEFWLLPDKFMYHRGEEINIRFLVGENFEGENWSGDSSKINKLLYYYGGVKDDLPRKLFPGKGDTLHLRQYDEGTNMLTYNSFNAFIKMEAGKFNEYLTEDGLTDAVNYRTEHNETDSAGREFYQRSVKTIFQVGNVKDETYKQPTSLPLDIIPLSHPYRHMTGAEMSFKILFQNSPLPNTMIKIWHHGKNRVVTTVLTTDENGLVKFPVETNGRWMVSCVKMVRLDRNENSEIYIPWQSYWGSCTWGYY